MRLLIRADASSRMGGGHVMRCLTLADALAARGGETHFVAASMPPSLAAKIARAGHAHHPIAGRAADAVDDRDWDSSVLPADEQRADAALSLGALAGQNVDWMIVDHYRLDHVWQQAVRPTGARILVIDDLANRAHDCDLLLDQTVGRRAVDYVPWLPSGTTVLAGAHYAPLRAEFAAARPAALERRRRNAGPVERLLVSLGTTDVGGITAKVLRILLAAGAECAIDVVLGADAPSLGEVEEMRRSHPGMELHIDSCDMAGLMVSADLAIGAAGTTSWERCCLGLPCLTLVLAENQRFIAEQLARAGAHALASLNRPDALAASLARLLGVAAARKEMAKAAAAVTDGLGADRVVAAMIGQPLETPGN